MQMPLNTARKYAEQIAAQLEPFCERIEIAGSIRRQRPVVNDIDLVVLAKDAEGLRRRCLEHCTAITHGDSVFSVETRTGVQVDLFFAHAGERTLLQPVPSNWGSVLLQRTGSREHNIYLVERAKQLGMRWALMTGIMDADFNILGADSEEGIFKALQLDFVPPEKRER